jgi:monoamine oxidase
MLDGSNRLNRRRALATAGGAGLAALFDAAIRPRDAFTAEKRNRVIVVGAGMAGLMAASTLESHGHAAIVIDARDRIGGRVWTSDLGGTPVDLGAQWIEGINNNPLAEFCKRNQIKTIASDEDSFRLFDADGLPFDKDEADKLRRWSKEVLKPLGSFDKNRRDTGQADMTIGEAFSRLTAGQQMTERQRRYLRWALTINIEATEGEDAERLSLRNYQTEEEIESFDGPEHILPGGFGQIAKLIAKGLDIRLGRRATAIHYGNRHVRVVCEKEEFQADAAVVTLPLGVLKSSLVTFDPKLPQSKLDAIARLGVASAHKVVLKFPRRFWQSTTDFLASMPDDGAKFVEWTDLSRTTGAPILSLWSHGRAARGLEQLSRGQATDEAMKTIRRALGRSSPDPEQVVVTSWINDPLSRGCYTNLPVGASHNHMAALAAPVDRLLFFAGEATTRRHRGTVHGAWLSGIRAAEEIAALGRG